MSKHAVARAEDLADGQRLFVQLEGREIAVINVDGTYHAVLNWCPHQSGPLCEGTLSGTVAAEFDRETLEVSVEWVRDDQIVACPWHGWEFDIVSGQCLSDEGVSVPTYTVDVEDGDIVVEIP